MTETRHKVQVVDDVYIPRFEERVAELLDEGYKVHSYIVSQVRNYALLIKEPADAGSGQGAGDHTEKAQLLGAGTAHGEGVMSPAEDSDEVV